MIGKLAVALAAPFVMSATDAPEPVFVDVPQIKQVFCDGGMIRGTAWRVGNGSYVSARHVTHGRDCVIDGEPANVTYESEALDFVSIRTARFDHYFQVDCTGFVDGQDYLAIGYARGEPRQQVIAVRYVAEIDRALPHWGKFVTLFGDRFIPGMSGGVVINMRGQAVGVVNGYSTDAPLSYSQPLSDTPLCA